jgi:hypothetical protein
LPARVSTSAKATAAAVAPASSGAGTFGGIACTRKT